MNYKKRRSLAGGRETTRLCFMKKIILLALLYVLLAMITLYKTYMIILWMIYEHFVNNFFQNSTFFS